MQIQWGEYDAGYRAKIGDLTLFVSPEQTRDFGRKPKRGTKWRYGATHWNAETSTATRYGADCYVDARDDKRDAMRAAEQVYNAARIGA